MKCHQWHCGGNRGTHVEQTNPASRRVITQQHTQEDAPHQDRPASARSIAGASPSTAAHHADTEPALIIMRATAHITRASNAVSPRTCSINQQSHAPPAANPVFQMPLADLQKEQPRPRSASAAQPTTCRWGRSHAQHQRRAGGTGQQRHVLSPGNIACR